MRAVSLDDEGSAPRILPLMLLRDKFRQRKIEETFGSFRSAVPLRLPSGPQHVESELEAELLEQFAFSHAVYDLLTQPIIEYTRDGQVRDYALDIAVLLVEVRDIPGRYLIEVKRRADLEKNADKLAAKFEGARAAAKEWNASFRIMTEAEIRTPYLQNARYFRRYQFDDPELEAFEFLESELGSRSISMRDALRLLGRQGMAEPDARAGIEQAIAWKLLYSDLTRPFDDSSMISIFDPKHRRVGKSDPILRLLNGADR